jgi:hypothetical protein
MRLQITSDLATFWRSSYPAVKKEQKGRYPKHYWPDDPLQAIATKQTKKAMDAAPSAASKAQAGQAKPQPTVNKRKRK